MKKKQFIQYLKTVFIIDIKILNQTQTEMKNGMKNGTEQLTNPV